MSAYTEPGTLEDVTPWKRGELLWLKSPSSISFSKPNYTTVGNGWEQHDGPSPRQGSPFIFTGNVTRYVIPNPNYPDGKYITPYIEVISTSKEIIWIPTFSLSIDVQMTQDPYKP